MKETTIKHKACYNGKEQRCVVTCRGAVERGDEYFSVCPMCREPHAHLVIVEVWDPDGFYAGEVHSEPINPNHEENSS